MSKELGSNVGQFVNDSSEGFKTSIFLDWYLRSSSHGLVKPAETLRMELKSAGRRQLFQELGRSKSRSVVLLADQGAYAASQQPQCSCKKGLETEGNKLPGLAFKFAS